MTGASAPSLLEENEMIETTSLNAAHTLSEKLAAANRGLIAVPRSVLAACIEASKTPMAYDHTNDDWQTAWVGSLGAAPIWGTRDNVTLDDEDGGQTVILPTAVHECTMNEATGVASCSVVTALAAARNIHKPIIADFIERVSKQIEITNQIIEPVELIDIHLNPAWEEPAIRALINRYGKDQRSSIVNRSEIPAIPCPADLDDLVRTGSAQVDKAFAELLREAGLTVSEVFDSIFNSSGNIGGGVAKIWLTRNKLLAQFVLVSILADTPPEGTGMSKNKWETLCSRLMMAMGYICWVHAKEEESVRESKRLVADVDVAAGKIYLHGAVYDKWLDEGGVPELIYGAYLDTNSIKDVKYDLLLENKEQHLGSWRRYHSVKAARDEQDLVARIKNALLLVIGDMAKTIDPTALAPNMTPLALVNWGNDVVRALAGAEWTRDLGLTCLKVACDVFFSHTPSKRLLLRINDLVNNRQMEAEEAASVAAIEYMNDWLAGQVQIRAEDGVDSNVVYHQNMVVLSNLTELSTRALMAAIGVDTSKAIEGERISRQLLADTAVARIGQHASTFVKS